MFVALARIAEHRVGNFNAQDFGSMAWAFATADRSDAPLFRALARKMDRCVSTFNAQDLANTA